MTQMSEGCLIVYYDEEGRALTYAERTKLNYTATVIEVSPHHVVLQDAHGKTVIVTQVGMPGTPEPPSPAMTGKKST